MTSTIDSKSKMTAEDHARRNETQRLVRERIAYHEARARAQEVRPTEKPS